MTVISRRTRTWISVATVCALAVALIPLLPPLNNAQASVFTPNVFGVVQQAPPDPNGPPWSAWEAQSLPTQIQSISIYRVSVTGSSPNSQLVRTLIASDTRSGADDSVMEPDPVSRTVSVG